MAEIGRSHARYPHPQDHRGARHPPGTGRLVRASGAGAGCRRVLLSRRQKRNHGAQHTGDDIALPAQRSGSAHHPRHDRGAGEEQISRPEKERPSVIAVPFIGFAVIAFAAIGFATFTLWRRQVKGGALLAGAIALFMLGVGGGTYWMVGRPALATRAAQGLSI